MTRVGALDVFDLAARAANEGRVDDALAFYDALTRDHDLDIRSEARFRKGQLLASRRRFREAAATYRRLLDEKPDAARVRLELAGVLASLGDEIGARREIRLAQAAGLPPEVAEQVSQFSRALRSPKRIGGSFEATLAPDSNINRGTQARTLDTVIAPLILSRDARETSGVGLRMRASAFAKQPVTDRVGMVARASGAADLYRDSATDDVLGTVQLGVEWRGPMDLVSLAYGYSRRWYGDRPFARTRPVTVDWLHQLDRVTQLTTSVSRATIRYDRNPLQDGVLTDASLTAERALSARTGVAVGITAGRQDARDPSYAAWSFGPLAYGWHERGRTTLFASLAARRLIGDARNFLFTARRQERFVSARAGATFRGLAVRGFAPTVRLGYERNASAVAIFDYRRAFGEVGLSRTF